MPADEGLREQSDRPRRTWVWVALVVVAVVVAALIAVSSGGGGDGGVPGY
jgi:hypothetical protein